MTHKALIERLFSLQDTAYRDFQAKLIPTVSPETVIGVRTPALKILAKQLIKEGDVSSFLAELPHRYFDENQLHAFLINEEKDFGASLSAVTRFLPFINNWATCDQLSPKAFKKNPDALLPHIREWLSCRQTYTVRFAIGMLMQHFLDERFDENYPAAVAAVHSEEYYINMMVAWYFATALAKRYDALLPFIEQKRLDPWTHNKAIQKAVESYRITAEQKEYLRTLKLPPHQQTRQGA